MNPKPIKRHIAGLHYEIDILTQISRPPIDYWPKPLKYGRKKEQKYNFTCIYVKKNILRPMNSLGTLNIQTINIFNLIYSIIYSCHTLSHVTTTYWSWPWPCNFALITFCIWNHLPSKWYQKFYPYKFWRSGFFFLYCDSIFCLQRVIIKITQKKKSSPIVAKKCTFFAYEQIMINRPAESPSNQ